MGGGVGGMGGGVVGWWGAGWGRPLFMSAGMCLHALCCEHKERSNRLEFLLGRGLLNYSFFAGKGTATTCIEWLKQLALQAGFVFNPQRVGTVMGCG